MKLVSLIGVALVSLVIAIAAWAIMGRPSGVASDPTRLTIAAASDLRFALDELVATFRDTQEPDADVSVAYGSSGNFFAQLSNGAPFDLFVSADVVYPRQLISRGLADPASEFLYAEGRIAVWVPDASPLEVERLGLSVVMDPAVTRVAIANPEHAPYGRAAEAALRTEGLLERVRPKLVLGENISQTLQFVQSGSADVGIVALALALAPPVRGTGRYWLVPAGAHPRLEQGGVVMRTAEHPEMAARFRDFMTGERGRATLARYGFTFPTTSTGGEPER